MLFSSCARYGYHLSSVSLPASLPPSEKTSSFLPLRAPYPCRHRRACDAHTPLLTYYTAWEERRKEERCCSWLAQHFAAFCTHCALCCCACLLLPAFRLCGKHNNVKLHLCARVRIRPSPSPYRCCDTTPIPSGAFWFVAGALLLRIVCATFVTHTYVVRLARA